MYIGEFTYIIYDQILSALYCAIAMFLKVQWNPTPHPSRVNVDCSPIVVFDVVDDIMVEDIFVVFVDVIIIV